MMPGCDPCDRAGRCLPPMLIMTLREPHDRASLEVWPADPARDAARTDACRADRGLHTARPAAQPGRRDEPDVRDRTLAGQCSGRVASALSIVLGDLEKV